MKKLSIRTLAVCALVMAITACDVLDVTDPTAVLESELDNAQGAELYRRESLSGLFLWVPWAAWYSGLMSDEFLVDPPSANTRNEFMDRRDRSGLVNTWGQIEHYASFQGLRIKQTTLAIQKLSEFALPGDRQAKVGEMYAVRGYITLRLAEDFCAGFPLHEAKDFKLIYGSPVTTDQAFTRALADFDSAIASASDSARVLNFARIGRARSLLGLGRFAEAATTVAQVPTAYVYQTEYSATESPFNSLGSELNFQGWGTERSVADKEGGNGLDFISANDPRVRTNRLGTAKDGTTGLYGIGKYPNRAAPIVLASGIEARLIEAEAALNAGSGQWLTILNDLRATNITPAMSALADPGTATGRVNLLFRERAFWLFATGTRLADLRRLIARYGRSAESVFPTGAYRVGGNYSAGISLPFDKAEAQSSPGVSGCTAP